MTRNGYLEFEPTLKKEELIKINKTENLYIKASISNLGALEESITLSAKSLTIEIIQNSKHAGTEELEKFIFHNKPSRIIIALEEYFDNSVLESLEKNSYKNLSIDLYWNKQETLEKSLFELLNKYKSINHFSLYPKSIPLTLEDNFLGFKRYHHNMWSKDPYKYYADYDFRTIKEKNYIGVGRNAVSRDNYCFYKNNKKLKLTKKYIDFQDHIDRLNYYFPLSEEELSKYPLIDKEKYLNNLLGFPEIKLHQKLISDLWETQKIN